MRISDRWKFIIGTVLILFIVLLLASGTGYRNSVYKIYWEKPSGETVIFEKVNRLNGNLNYFEFVDLKTKERITISGGLVKTVFIEKKFNWVAWLGRYDN